MTFNLIFFSSHLSVTTMTFSGGFFFFSFFKKLGLLGPLRSNLFFKIYKEYVRHHQT